MEVILLVLMANLGYAFESISYKYFSKMRKTTALFGINLTAFLLFFCICVVFAITNFSLFSANLNATSILTIALNALLMLGQATLWMTALHYVKMSIMDPIINFQMVLATLLSWVIFGDSVGVPELILLVIIFIFCLLLGYDQNKTNTQTLQQYEINKQPKNKFIIGLLFLCIWMMLSIAKNLIAKNLLVNNLNPITYQTIYYFIAFLFVCIAMLFIYRKKENRIQLKQQLAIPFRSPWFYVNAVSVVISGLGYLFLIKNFNIGVIQALMNIYIIIVMIYGKVVFKEKISKLSYLYVAVIIIAASILSYLLA